MKEIPFLFGGHAPPAYDPYETDSDFEGEEQPPPPSMPPAPPAAPSEEGGEAAAAAAAPPSAGPGVDWADPEQRKAFLKQRAAGLKAEVRAWRSLGGFFPPNPNPSNGPSNHTTNHSTYATKIK